jgi:hypothetical protein
MLPQLRKFLPRRRRRFLSAAGFVELTDYPVLPACRPKDSPGWRIYGDAKTRNAVVLGRKVMEWSSQKTSIAGIQISNWLIVLGAIIIVKPIYTSMH